VLVLENPKLRGQSRITQSLYAGLQLILPGEIAPPHRHSPAAIRFILDGEGAYTQVDGEKTLMSPGDFVLTPSGTIHDHGNESKKSTIWLDVLDVPTVNFFETCFYEHFDYERQNTRRADGDSLDRYGSGVLPDGTAHRNSPIVNYPYAKMRQILERLARAGDIDPHHGARFRYANPLTGGPVMPTMGARLQLLRPGEATQPHRHTGSAIYQVAKGRGWSEIGGKRFEWQEKDIFALPSWALHRHGNASATDEAVLFSFDDSPAMRSLGLYREETRPG
jgi:gentisate 1,2-dioxygenase